MTPVSFRRTRSWNVPEKSSVRPEFVLLALGMIGMLLTEVWGSARVAELSLELDQTRSALAASQVRLAYDQAGLERGTTRNGAGSYADGLGLAPADPRQFVALPASFLEDEDAPNAGAKDAALLAAAERISRALVPDATARGRIER